MTLVEFLRERLDEDEQAARDAEQAHPPVGWLIAYDADAMHARRHDPARVLAEVDAKRQRIEHYLEVCRLADPVTDKHQAYVLAEGAVRKSLMFDALPYADHRDYRDEWRP